MTVDEERRFDFDDVVLRLAGRLGAADRRQRAVQLDAHPAFRRHGGGRFDDDEVRRGGVALRVPGLRQLERDGRGRARGAPRLGDLRFVARDGLRIERAQARLFGGVLFGRRPVMLLEAERGVRERRPRDARAD